jgi:hypothetical protein
MRAATIVCASAVLLAGCGDDGEDRSADVRSSTTTAAEAPAPPPPKGRRLTKAEYETTMRATLKQIADTTQEVAREQAGTDEPTTEQIGLIFARLQGSMRNAAAQLDRVRPPAEVARAHADYIVFVRAMADGLQPIIERLQAGDQQGAQKLMDNSITLVDNDAKLRGARARKEFQEKGYELGMPEVGPVQGSLQPQAAP